jgi:hypothetical protein
MLTSGRASRAAVVAAPQATAPPSKDVPAIAPPATAARAATSDAPIVPPGIEQFFVPADAVGAAASGVAYVPVVLGAARVSFADPERGVEETRDVVYLAPLMDDAVAMDWQASTRLELTASDLERTAVPGATYGQLPDAALKAKSYGTWEKSFSRWLSQSERVELLHHRDLGLTSRPDESERDFRIRVQDAQREARDRDLDALRKKYAPKQAQLAEQERRARAAVARETEQASQAKLQTAVSMGATLLGALLGRKAASVGNLGRATTAARGVGRSMKESEDIKRASETVESAEARARALDEQLEAEAAQLKAKYDAPIQLETLAVAPKRGQIAVQFVALAWVPAGAGRGASAASDERTAR